MDEQKDQAENGSNNKKVPRRHFIRIAGTLTVAVGLTGWIISSEDEAMITKLADGRSGIPISGGYLLVDIKKCQGCVSCMLACSLVNEGVENLSLSRIQIIQNSFDKWPEDLTIEQCRQCVDPGCVKACPENALKVDTHFGNIRRVVAIEKCIGCGSCVDECPFTPSRPIVTPDEKYEGDYKARKCALCADAPFHWDPKGGGPKGKQACVEVCPVGAIEFTSEVPIQEGDSGYHVNLRDYNWKLLGFPKD